MQITFECALVKAPTKHFIWHSAGGDTTLEDMLKTIRKMGLRPADVVITGIKYEHDNGSMAYTL